ncbi:queuosine salvage protein-like isoform X2 [Varroa destructor]|uniref:Queuosine 5'-phosphate N-glycosylase/hydrolase n=1 Tax=Varroa destructor TaxID=109461 RepID=A0A7M7MHB2_VARDE|nr:queuosine salvage protein-like isoform X2 [Varroa destructor]
MFVDCIQFYQCALQHTMNPQNACHPRDDILGPRQSAIFIAGEAEDVIVKTEGLRAVANMIHGAVSNNAFSVANWKQHPLNPKQATEQAVEWIFVVDLLNFSFWSTDYQVEYGGKIYHGYWSLCASVNRALEENIPMIEASFYSTVSKEQLKMIFRSNNGSEIPLFDQRLEILHQAGAILKEKYAGKFVNCIRACKSDALGLLSLLVNEFPSFRDEAVYKSKKVSFYKRAQILVADLWACFEGQSLGEFYNIDDITIFADYRVPQVLVYLGAIEYSPKLMARLQEDQLLENDSREVCEIRGVTIYACEVLHTVLFDSSNFLHMDDLTSRCLRLLPSCLHQKVITFPVSSRYPPKGF